TDANGGNSNDELTITVNGPNVRVYDPNLGLKAGAGTVQVNLHTVEAPLSSISGSILINSLAGDDSPTVDLDGGAFPRPIVYNGGDQNTADTLDLIGATPLSNLTFNYTNENDGSVVAN